KTEYSSLAAVGFENKNIIQQLIADIVFFLIFLRIEKLNMVILSIRDPDKNRFYSFSTGFVSSFITHYC
ncbi:8533_t:CDS:1, partial [Scutellospora calospora]